MSRAPSRSREVHFIGAGFSKAFGLPLTSEILQLLEELSESQTGSFLNQEIKLDKRLKEVFSLFYPDGNKEGFRPSVVDFFSTLSTYIDLSKSMPDSSFPGQKPAAFLRNLKSGIVRILTKPVLDDIDAISKSPVFDDLVTPGSIIITSNWDLLIESVAKSRNIPIRRTLAHDRKVREKEVTLLKLHGSVDWLMNEDRVRRYEDEDFRPLSTLSHYQEHKGTLPSEPNVLIRTVSEGNNTWRTLKSRTSSPHIVTMATGKVDDLGPLEGVWRDAYAALSFAKKLTIIGYSMPQDDLEIRTLLRAGIRRGKQKCVIHVQNPSPEVHERVRRFIDDSATSNFTSIQK